MNQECLSCAGISTADSNTAVVMQQDRDNRIPTGVCRWSKCQSSIESHSRLNAEQGWVGVRNNKVQSLP